METLVLIVFAVTLHYALDYLGERNKIDCPPYCEVDHKHTIRETQDDWNNGNNNVKREEKEHLLRVKRDDKHSSSE